jgi:uncharacterized protein YndB with AHSA1/START domain
MTTTKTPVVRLTRTFAATPARVYRAWLDPAMLSRWMTPGDLAVTAARVDARVGGRFSVRHADSGGADAGGFEAEYREIEPDERLVLQWGFVGPDHVADHALDSLLTLEFRAVGADSCELSLTHERLDALHDAMPLVADNVSVGWGQALALLSEVVAS